MKTNRFVMAIELVVLAGLILGLSVGVPEKRPNASLVSSGQLQTLFERISADSMLETVRFLAGQRTRRFTSEGSTAAERFITNRLEHLGFVVEHHHVNTVDAAGRPAVVTNVLTDLVGPGRARSSLIICAHYDSRGKDWNDPAPGADDNASGVAVLLEAARVFAETGVKPRVTLVFFGGEEDSLIGSRGFAEEVLREKLPLRGVINVDMVGYDAYGPLDIVVFTNPQSIPLALELVENARRTTRLVADTTVATTGNSDHAPFWRAGQPAVSIWEGYDHNPYHCTTKDVPVILTPYFLVEVAKLIVSTAVHLGGTVDVPARAAPPSGR
jgi:Zn-dependent M28 family amino/carboxypeptidase